MKVGQKNLVRWISERVGKRSEPIIKSRASQMRELDSEQLRHVGGGNGSTQLPKVGW
jgi:uncharacterized membrane protein YqiK